jgi:ABC-type branched-subunit amino acid transport system substrate-binding protein
MIARLFVFLFVLLNSSQVIAQSGDDEAFFRRGVLLFKQGKYVSASLDFKEIINHFPSGVWVQPSYMLLSKTFFQLGEYEKAESTALELKNRFPKSPYTEWTSYLVASCKYKNGEPVRAAEILAELVRKTHDDSLKIRSLSALKYSIVPALDNNELNRILEENGITQMDLDSAEPFTSPETKLRIAVAVPDSSSTIGTGKWEGASSFKIGLIAPLTGINADLGLQLFKGVQTVFEKEDTTGDPKVELLVEDTESDPVTAALVTRKLIEEGVIAIIGPVLSETTVVAAVEAQSHDITFIAPTSQSVGLTRLGQCIFQLNFNPVIQAEALAHFALTSLKASNYVVIASSEWWGEAVTQTFSKEMEKSGAVRVWTEFIDPTLPISDQNIVMNIRDHAPESYAKKDSLVVFDYGNVFQDSLFIKRDIIVRGEKKLPSINSIDCVLISAASEDVIQIAGQLVEYNVDTVILCDSGWWINESAFEGGEEYIEGAYVVAPPGELSGGIGLSYFNGSSKSSNTRDIPLMKGADACKLLLYCLKNGARNPSKIIEMHESIIDYQGVSSKITFERERHVNTAVDFVRVQQGRYVRVDKTVKRTSYKSFEVESRTVSIQPENSLSSNP